MSFPNKTVLITGAGSGIGRGIAERFAEARAAVALLDINGPPVEAFAEQLPRAIAIAGDVASEADSRAAVERTVAAFGRVDVLVNNAGIELNGTVVEMQPDAWNRQLSVNLTGAYMLSRAAIPHMPAGGSIVNIASVHAYFSYPKCPAYDASKAGLIGLTRAMALDHGRQGIRVNVICPGYIDTPMLDKWLDGMTDREAEMAKILEAHPLGRIGTPRDIAEAALWLSSDAARFVTGASLIVDGGMTIAGH
jgi:NAD(P)-dependent dehydrogenase (short-subunit alcohol dehydrogenase family)